MRVLLSAFVAIRIRHYLGMIIVVGGFGGTLMPSARADVIVISNRTAEILKFETIEADEKATGHRLLPSESKPIPVSHAIHLWIPQEFPTPFTLQPNSAYFFATGPQGLVFEEIGFRIPLLRSESTDSTVPTVKIRELPTTGSVKVHLMIDDELDSRQDFEQQLRHRVRAASAIMEQAARIQFETVSVGHWESIDGVSDFETLLVDFERKVKVKPGELAIGFSQQASRSTKHLGGTRLPLHSHILVRARGRRVLSEQAQLEVLVHELGHYLGAMHSPERSSAMRSKLADGLAGTPEFRIGLDPVNTLIVYLVGEELRGGRIGGVWDLSPDVKAQLRRIYLSLEDSLPDDEMTTTYRRALDLTAEPSITHRVRTPLWKHSRQVLQEVTAVAEHNVQLPDQRVAERYGKPYRLDGDKLTEAYVRCAAKAAVNVPAGDRPRVFAVGLAVALDTSLLWRTNSLTSFAWRSIEADQEYQFRKGVLGVPTMHGRPDSPRYFFVSSALAALQGSRLAEANTSWEEEADENLAHSRNVARLAGIRFFEHVKANPAYLDDLAREFRVNDYLPRPPQSTKQHTPLNPRGAGHTSRQAIIEEINQLPGYSNQHFETSDSHQSR